MSTTFSKSIPEIRGDLDKALDEANAYIDGIGRGPGDVLAAYASAYGLLRGKIGRALDDIDEALEPDDREEDEPDFIFPERVVS
jgi:hypothetical protein